MAAAGSGVVSPAPSAILTAKELSEISFPFLSAKPVETSDPEYPTMCPMCLGSLAKSFSMGCHKHEHVLCENCAEMMVAMAFTRAGEPTVSSTGEGEHATLTVSKAKLEIECIMCLDYDDVRRALVNKTEVPKAPFHELPHKSEIAMPTFRSVVNSLQPHAHICALAEKADNEAKKFECDGPGTTPCGKLPTKRCPPCGEAFYCEECDAAMHTNPKRAHHIRIPAGDASMAKLLTVPCCPRHPRANLDFFNATEGKKAKEADSLYCSACKMAREMQFPGEEWEGQPMRIDTYQKDLQRFVRSIDERHAEVKLAAAAVQSTNDRLAAHWAETQKRLVDTRSVLLETVETTMKSLTDEARRTYQLRAATLHRQHELLSTVTKHLQRLGERSTLHKASECSQELRSLITTAHHTAYKVIDTTRYKEEHLIPAAIPDLHADVRGLDGVVEAIKTKALTLVTAGEDESATAAVKARGEGKAIRAKNGEKAEGDDQDTTSGAGAVASGASGSAAPANVGGGAAATAQ